MSPNFRGEKKMGEKMLIILAQEIIFLLSPDAKTRDDNDGNNDDSNNNDSDSNNDNINSKNVDINSNDDIDSSKDNSDSNGEDGNSNHKRQPQGQQP